MNNIFDNAKKCAVYINNIIKVHKDGKKYEDKLCYLDSTKDHHWCIEWNSIKEIFFFDRGDPYVVSYPYPHLRDGNNILLNGIEYTTVLYEKDDIFALSTIYEDKILFPLLVLQNIELSYDEIIVFADIKIITNFLGIEYE